MTKKAKNIIALVLFVAVWGIIISRLWENSQIEEALEETQSNYSNLSYSPLMFNKDTFELVLPDVDPFLKKSTSKFSSSNYMPSTTTSSPKVTKKEEPKVQKNVPWPSINYLGFVNNRSENNPLCLIKINGQVCRMSKGDNQNDVSLVKVFRDSVYIVYKGEERTFRK